MFPAVIKPWIVSLRLRTLPLQHNVLLWGVFCCIQGNIDFVVLILALVTNDAASLLSFLPMIRRLGPRDRSRGLGPERSIQRGN
jgi:hypothetical protein